MGLMEVIGRGEVWLGVKELQGWVGVFKRVRGLVDDVEGVLGLVKEFVEGY